MKKLLLNLVALLLVLSLTACATYTPPDQGPGGIPPDTNPGDGASPDEGGGTQDGEANLYKVSFVVNGLPYVPDAPITVRWTGEGGVFSATTDSTGVASAVLDGDYTVTVHSLPNGYTYNPNDLNQNRVSTLKTDTVIDLYEIQSVPDATDKGTRADPINIFKPGVYRIQLTDSTPRYYRFTPSSAGKYQLESWVDSAADRVNPVGLYLGANSNFLLEPTPIKSCEKEGYCGGFTKNFSWDYEVDDSNISISAGGVAFTFGFTAELTEGQISEQNPIYIDVHLDYLSFFDRPENQSELILPSELPGDNELAVTVGGVTYLLDTKDKASWERLLGSVYYLYDRSAAVVNKGPLASVDFSIYDADPPVGAVTLEHDLDGNGVYMKTHYSFTLTERTLSLELIDGIDVSPTFIVKGEQADFLRLHNSYESGVLGPESLSYTEVVGGKAHVILSQYRDIKNADGSTTRVELIKYNPADGYYHLYDAQRYTAEAGYKRAGQHGFGNGFGPILYAHITSACIFIPDSAISLIEYAGNKALTVNSGTENYKLFIEGYDELIKTHGDVGPYFCNAHCPCFTNGDENERCPGACLKGCTKCLTDCRHPPAEAIGMKGYADFANSDGMCPVTEELKEFLQKFAVSQYLFKDGYGFAEVYVDPKYNASEGNQWLFACGYYAD